MNGRLYESEYEESVMQLLADHGWTATHGGEMTNRKLSEALIEDDLRSYLHGRYAQEALGDDEADGIIANLRNTGGDTLYHTLRSVVSLYRDGYSFHRYHKDEDLFVEYIDFMHPERNVFRCVNQYVVSYNGGRDVRIPDVLLFVNGIPVCIIELKNPTDYNATIAKAYDQIHIRYRRDIPHLMKYCALSCISDGSNTRLGTTYTPYIHYYAWKKVHNEDKTAGTGLPELHTLLGGAFAPERLLMLLRDFVYFPDLQTHKEEEIVCRYPQFFATQKLFANVVQHLRSVGGDGKGGTYFGATGCGKTYTMLFLARQLMLRSNKAELASPTVIIMVDREDLQEQSGVLFCNSSDFLSAGVVRVIENRQDLSRELTLRSSGGVFICTIQKFCENTGLLSERSNIIVFSDEAHRTQTGIGSQLKIEGQREAINGHYDAKTMGAFVTYGFAKYLRDAFPNATYVGFTGTPIDETIHVFGKVVERYTMKEAVDDGITVDLKYIPRLARVMLDQKKAAEIEAYYKQCADEGATDEDVRKSKEAMAKMEVILSDEGRIARVALDIAEHYERLCSTKPDVVQKAMIVCANRPIAYRLYTKLRGIRPEWFVAKKCEDESRLSEEELERLEPLPMVNMVATRNANDPKEMYDLLGDKPYRKMLDKQFKQEHSNFRIAIVVDMWITGFDVPCLSVLYNDKPLQKHTLIQTISRVNRRYEGKEYGLIVDYIGIRENMRAAIKEYGGEQFGPSDDDLDTAYTVFVNELNTLRGLTQSLDFSPFFSETPLVRLQFLQQAAEYVMAQPKQGQRVSYQTLFKQHVRRLRSAYNICQPAGTLQDEEAAWAQCYMAIYSFVSKMTGGQHDTESMNRAVETMAQQAIVCGSVEGVFKDDDEEQIFTDEYLREVEENVRLPHTKFQMLLRVLKRAIREYGKTNKVAAKRFDEMLQQVVEAYNTRDRLDFATKVVGETVSSIEEMINGRVNELSGQLVDIFHQLQTDKSKFRDLGITFEEKAFYDILVEVRNTHQFAYDDDRCVALARSINELVAGTAVYADWLNNGTLKRNLARDVSLLLYRSGYPPEWDEEVFRKVLEQVENFKTYENGE